eukprot:3439365-Rhodomonas_salina.5
MILRAATDHPVHRLSLRREHVKRQQDATARGIFETQRCILGPPNGAFCDAKCAFQDTHKRAFCDANMGLLNHTRVGKRAILRRKKGGVFGGGVGRPVTAPSPHSSSSSAKSAAAFSRICRTGPPQHNAWARLSATHGPASAQRTGPPQRGARARLS